MIKTIPAFGWIKGFFATEEKEDTEITERKL